MSTDIDIVEPILDVDDIQGNVLAGFNKDHQTLLGLLIKNKENAKQWIQSISNRISTLYEVHNFNKDFKIQRKRLEKEPEEMKASWINIAFSFNGLKQLVEDTDTFDGKLDRSFKLGLYAQSFTLGDPIDTSSSGYRDNWEIGEEKTGKYPVPDILLIMASDTPDMLNKEIEDIKKTLSKDLEIVCDETGHDLSYYDLNKRGKEHFGFKDGISQPEIRGRLSSNINEFLTSNRDNDSSLDNNEYEIDYTSNGRPLIAPGEFVLGYPTQNKIFPRRANPVAESYPKLLKNCSYLVFRKLRQDVKGFEEFSKSESERLSLIENFSDISAEKIKALFVGRWPSGAPLSLSPNNDDESIASDSNRNNKFDYTDDENGYNTPYFSHIRKINPREIDTEEGSFTETLKRRILRRGIPYGPLFDSLVLDDNKDRGLLFLSYQASIEGQFEFLTKAWANTADKPPPPQSLSPELNELDIKEFGGHDSLIGQTNNTDDDTHSHRIRHGNLMRRINNKLIQVKITNEKSSIKDWVIPRGGGYFFVPSISMIKKIGKDGGN